jgi:putative PIN family toxin of toxin-antitoxin system
VIDRRPRNPRALIDANILISIMLSPDPARSAAAALLAEAEAGSFVAVVPIEALEEVERVTNEKAWLAKRMLPHAIDHLTAIFRRVGEVAPRLQQSAPSIARDPGDDYLLAQAVVARVDLLITLDRDLLDLGEVAGVRIVDPVTFLRMIRASSGPG